MKNEELLISAAEELNITLKKEQVEKFFTYMRLLQEWNEKINLTAIIEDQEIISKHFIDSLTCVEFIRDGDRIIDVGTGAGFPGLPIKIFNESKNEIVLMDSLNKRIKFLNDIINHLNLDKITAVHGRVEEMANKAEHREKYDVVTARAVANLSVLAEYCIPFIKVGGRFLCMKGGDAEEELKQARKAIEMMGGKVANIKKIKLPYSDITHSIIEIVKQKNTPKGYPRKAGKPEKEPIK